MRISHLLPLALLLSPAGLATDAGTVSGDYLEVRTCDVYTGPCFAMAEVGASGKEATLAWRIREGEIAGADLAGLSVVAVVQASATLGDPYADPLPARTLLYLDERADPGQRRALRAFALDQIGAFGEDIAAETAARIDIAVGCCDKRGCADLSVEDEIRVKTRCVCEDDIHCGNETVYYPPLAPGVDVIPAVATEHRIESPSLDSRIVEHERRGAFTGAFAVAAPNASSLSAASLVLAAASAVAGGKDQAPGKFRLTELPRPERDTAPALPEEIPEAFAKLLDEKGLRMSGADGKPIYDLWFRSEVPLAEKPQPGMRIEFPEIPVGTFLGVLRSYGKEVDYKENPIPEGFFVMRYGIQPEDGDHMGTADTRDFVILTNFEEDTSPDPVSDMIDLGEMSILSSTVDHPMICYLVKPAGDQPAKPRIYRHPDRDEWIADVVLKTRTPGADEPGALRVGIVLVGISPHF